VLVGALFVVSFLVLIGSAQVAYAQLLEADLELTKTASVTEVVEGDQYFYVITVRNLGPNDVTLGDIRDFLPIELDIISINSDANCSEDVGQHAVLCSFSNLVVGATRTVTITVVVAETTTIPRNLINNADTFPDSSGFEDPDPSNDDESITVTQQPLIVGGGKIGDFVWNDLNTDGLQDAGEPGIGAVTVQLRDGVTNVLLQITNTDGNGFYQFTNLGAGSYQLFFILKAGFAGFSSQEVGFNINIDSNPAPNGRTPVFALAANEVNNSVDAGMFQVNGDEKGIGVGGEYFTLDTTALLVAGLQTNLAWIVSLMVLAIGIGVVGTVLVRRK